MEWRSKKNLNIYVSGFVGNVKLFFSTRLRTWLNDFNIIFEFRDNYSLKFLPEFSQIKKKYERPGLSFAQKVVNISHQTHAVGLGYFFKHCRLNFLAFRCAYCSNFNASRKKKLSVPALKTLNESALINQTATHETESQRPNETISFEKQEETKSMSSSVEQVNAKPDNLRDHEDIIQKPDEFIETLPADDETSAISIKKNE
jgi:hypothetical protein